MLNNNNKKYALVISGESLNFIETPDIQKNVK